MSLPFSHLPCNNVERVKFQPNKPTCHLWNTPQCGYGCGTCAGSDACMNYPFGQVGCQNNGGNHLPASLASEHGAPICNLQLDLAQQTGGACSQRQLHKNQNGGGHKVCVRRNRVGQTFVPQWGSVPNTMTDAMCTTNQTLDQCGGGHASPGWFNQQCGQRSTVGDCAGSGTKFGCNGGSCQDCGYYTKLAKNYRHMLTGALYPFCKE